jgi:Mce-associated membrane protein
MTDATTSEPQRSRRGWSLVAALCAVLIALLATSLVLSRRSTSQVDPSAIAIAKQEAINFFTLDYTHVDANINAVLALATDPFRQQYAAKSATIKAGVTSQHLTIKATVPANSAGLEYEHGSSAIVLVAVDETITAPNATPQSNRYRMRLHLAKLSGKWRVTQVQQVG